METNPLRLLLSAEKSFYALVVIYGVVISLLTLSIPISVQLLISTVANTAQAEPLVILAIALFVLLAFFAVFHLLQEFALELFQRRIYARITRDVALRLVYTRFGELETVNREELANRYFDVMTLQKNVPILLTGGVSLALQSAVGFAVTSFYHPLFLLFNVLVVALAAGIGAVLHAGAKESAVRLSEAKYDMAGWLEQLARTNAIFKSDRTIDYALERSERLSSNYVDRHRGFFLYTFSQQIGFVVLYALASAVLLGLGGALVIEGQLTLGQLVAAELILSAILIGLTRVGYYLRIYYELRAAAKKVAMLFDLPVEDVAGDTVGNLSASGLAFRDVRDRSMGFDVRIDIEIPAGAKVLVGSTTALLDKSFADLLRRFREPDDGRIELGDSDISDLDLHALRDQVVVVDDALVVDCSISEYLSIAQPAVSRHRMRQVLEQVGLSDAVQRIEEGLDAGLTPYGYPLSVSETMRLKLAHAILIGPRVIVLSHLFDTVGHVHREQIFEAIREIEGLTVVYFSHRRDIDRFDRFLHFTPTDQRFVESIEELRRCESDFLLGAPTAAGEETSR